jgi:hypothetical protein
LRLVKILVLMSRSVIPQYLRNGLFEGFLHPNAHGTAKH